MGRGGGLVDEDKGGGAVGLVMTMLRSLAVIYLGR